MAERGSHLSFVVRHLSFVIAVVVLAAVAARGGESKQFSVSVVTFTAAPGSSNADIQVGEDLESLRASITNSFKNTIYRSFTFAARGSASIADGGTDTVDAGGLRIRIRARQAEDRVALRVEVFRKVEDGEDEAVGRAHTWRTKPGFQCIQPGPPDGTDRVFVAVSVGTGK